MFRKLRQPLVVFVVLCLETNLCVHTHCSTCGNKSLQRSDEVVFRCTVYKEDIDYMDNGPYQLYVW